MRRHAAGDLVALVDGDLVACVQGVVGGGKAHGAGTDDCNLHWDAADLSEPSVLPLRFTYQEAGQMATLHACCRSQAASDVLQSGKWVALSAWVTYLSEARAKNKLGASSSKAARSRPGYRMTGT